MRRNPLISQLLSRLQQHPQGVSEHELILSLEREEAFQGLAESKSLSLFQKHFLVMNGLYQLQLELWQESGVMLEVSPLCTVIHPSHEGSAEAGRALLAEGSSLSAYYRDWENLEEMDEAGVDALLEGFWNRFLVEDQRGEALTTLGLEREATTEEVTRSYRRLVAQHHPDKGGDHQQFITIRRAYEVLMA